MHLHVKSSDCAGNHSPAVNHHQGLIRVQQWLMGVVSSRLCLIRQLVLIRPHFSWGSSEESQHASHGGSVLRVLRWVFSANQSPVSEAAPSQ